MPRFVNKIVAFLASFGFACVILMFLMLLVYLGTLEQVNHGLYEVQRRYFNSLYLWADVGLLRVPLPGVYLLLTLLAVNLAIGGILRLRKTWSRAGILIIHLGIALMLVAGLVKFHYSTDGHMTLYEGQSSNRYVSYNEWELAIAPQAPAGQSVTELAVDGAQFLRLPGGAPRTFHSAQLPFEVVVEKSFRNCDVLPKGPMFEVTVPVVDGYFLQEKPLIKEAERNIAGAYLRIQDPASGRSQQGIVWGFENLPWTVDWAGKTWTLHLRHKTWTVPFTVALDEFYHEFHPGTRTPREFRSDVTVLEGETSRPVRIEMNQPLRYKGFTFFQASWGPENAGPNEPLFSSFAVVRNPGDNLPLYSCFVIALGMLIHFGLKLIRYSIRAQNQRVRA